EAAAMVSERLATDVPAAVAALSELSGRLDERQMRALNRRVEVDGAPVAGVARDALSALSLIGAPARAAATDYRRSGVIAYLSSERGRLLQLTRRHLLLVAVSLIVAILVAVPLGLLLER